MHSASHNHHNKAELGSQTPANPRSDLARFRYLLAFGSNLGDKVANCHRALALLEKHVHLQARSPLLTTAALPHPSELSCALQADYVNFVAEVASSLTPLALYRCITKIEDQLGHSRLAKWLPRHMDIDILFWAHNDQAPFSKCRPLCFSDGLTIPHAEFWQRPFLHKLVGDGLHVSLADLAQHQAAAEDPASMTGPRTYDNHASH